MIKSPDRRVRKQSAKVAASVARLELILGEFGSRSANFAANLDRSAQLLDELTKTGDENPQINVLRTQLAELSLYRDRTDAMLRAAEVVANEAVDALASSQSPQD